MAACALVLHSLLNTFKPTTCLLRARISTLEVASSWPRSFSDGICTIFEERKKQGDHSSSLLSQHKVHKPLAPLYFHKSHGWSSMCTTTNVTSWSSRLFPYTDHLKTYLSQLSAQYFQHSVHPNIDVRQMVANMITWQFENRGRFWLLQGLSGKRTSSVHYFSTLFDTVCEEVDSLQITHKGWYFCFIQNCKKYTTREDATICQWFNWNGMNEFDLKVQESKLSMWSVMVLVKIWLVV